MIKVMFISCLLVLVGLKHSISQDVNIPDANFLQALINLGLDINTDGKIQFSEAAVVTNLNVSGKSISDLNGIEAFINLDTLDCSFNQLTTLDLSQNTKLTLLYCSINNLTELDLSANVGLKSLSCSNNDFTSLNISENPDLILLDCGFNQLTTLDVSGNMNLEILECYNNELDSLDLSGNPGLIILYCGNNKIRNLDMSANVDLKFLDCQFNSLINLNLSKNTALTHLACYSNQLTNLDVTKNSSLSHLDCGMNLYTYLDLSKNDSLTSVDCALNPNLEYICVRDTALVNNNFNFFKDNTAQWTQDCVQPSETDENQLTDMFQLTPNPGSENFNLLLKQTASVSILNSNGIEIERYDNVQNLEFGQSYRSGLYFVSIIFHTNKNRKVVKIIKD